MENNKREEGFYWVRCPLNWEVARLVRCEYKNKTVDFWWLTNTSEIIRNEGVTEINETRILNPDEQAQGVKGDGNSLLTIVYRRSKEGGFVGSVPSIPGTHSQGETISELVTNLGLAIKAITRLYSHPPQA